MNTMNGRPTTRCGRIAFLLLLTLLSCGARAAAPSPAPALDAPTSASWLNLTGIIPAPGEPVHDRIVFIFDRELSQTTSPLSFVPALPGRFEFGTNYLTFKPLGMPADRLTRATVSEALRGADGRPLNPRQRVLPVAATPLRPNNPWTIEATPKRIVLGLSFTFMVPLEQLRAHVEAADAAGAAVPCELTTATGARNFRLEFNKLDGVKWPLKVRLTKGLTETEGLLAMTDTYTFEYNAVPPPTLRVEDIYFGPLTLTTQTVIIKFSDSIDSAQVAPFIRVTDISTATPRVLPTRVWGKQNSDQMCFVSFSAPDPYDVKLRVEALAGMISRNRFPLQTSVSRDLAVRTALTLKGAVEGLQETEPYLVLRLSGNVEADDFRRHLTVTPAIDKMRIVCEDPNRFALHGDLSPDTRYVVTLGAGLIFNRWAPLRQDLSTTIPTPKNFPGFMRLAHEGKYYFPRTPDPALELTTRNVRGVELVLHRMFANNIPLGTEEMNNGDGNNDFIKRWSEEIARTKIDLSLAPGKVTTTSLHLKDILPAGMRGVFMLEVWNGEQPRETDQSGRQRFHYIRYYYDSNQRLTRVILMTRIGVLAHWTDGELSLLAHDLYSLAPIEGAHIQIFTVKNQRCGEGWTDAQGLVQLKNFNAALGTPSIALVEKEDDSTVLDLSDRNYQDQQQFTGDPYDRERYDAYIYADRALYRPGETVHLRWLGRTNYGDALTSVPLMLKVIKPNGDEMLNKTVVLSRWGTGELDVKTQKTDATGEYLVRLGVPGEEESLAGYTFQLEEFVPNRMKAAVEIPEPFWVSDATTHAVTVVGRHLFGTAAENRTTQARLFFSRGWSPAKWGAYRFENDTEYDLDSVDLGEKVTGGDGKAPYVFTLSMPQEVSSPLRVTAIGVVQEMGGRKVNARATTAYFPSEVCLGVRGEPTDEDGRIVIRAAAVKPDESPAALDHVEVTLERQVWSYVVRNYTTYQEPQWTGQYATVQTRQVPLKDGVGLTSFTAADYGYYRVRVHSPATRQYSTLLFYAFGGRCSVTQKVEPGLVKLSLSKPLYRVGETAELRVEAPFDGKAAIVIQGETIRRIMTIDVRKGIGVARFVVQPEDYPNAWLETTVIHAVDKKRVQVYPFASFAALKLTVDDPERQVAVELGNLPKEVRPAGPLTLAIQTRNGRGEPVAAEVTLAAVDEGIHSIRGYANPDPLGHFARPRRPDYRRAFYYDKVAYDFDQPTPGGDEDLAASLGRPQPNWIRTVALWSGPIVTGADGRATVTLEIPEFNGELRLVAVATGARSAGAWAGSLLVRRPWMLQTSMPRFMLPGDTAQCRATLYNLTDKPCRAWVSWTREGGLTGGEGRREFMIAAGGEANTTAEFTAGNAVGAGMIRWRAEFIDPATSRTLEKLAEDDPLPVTEPAAYQRREDLIVLHPNQTTTITNTFFLDDELTRIDLTVAPMPQLRLQKALSHVIGYPYGCVEQTTSKLIPLYLLRKSAGVMPPTVKGAEEIDAMIRAGIDRLFSMQTATGGLSFWPGGAHPYEYGSIYALHGLTLIRNGREFSLPENNFQILQNYVRQLVANAGGASLSSLYTRAYAVYVLALGGDKGALDAIERFDSLTLPRPARYLLAAALARGTRDTDRVKMYLANAPVTPWAVRETDGTLSSDIRNAAVELLSLGQMGAKQAEMAPLADKLTRYLETERYGTTQEYAFVTAALCDYLDALTTGTHLAKAVVHSPDNKVTTATGRQVFRTIHRGPGGRFAIGNAGGSDLYVSVATRGVPARALAEEVKQGLAVRRRVFTREGQLLTSATAFRQGASYIIEVELYNEQVAKNVVIADLLPGGLEVENPRLSKEEQAEVELPYATEAPTHLEIRDERVVLVYDRLEACPSPHPDNAHHFYYVVNAVTPGRFTYPAVSAECMYEPEVRGASQAGTAVVEGR